VFTLRQILAAEGTDAYRHAADTQSDSIVPQSDGACLEIVVTISLQLTPERLADPGAGFVEPSMSLNFKLRVLGPIKATCQEYQSISRFPLGLACVSGGEC